MGHNPGKLIHSVMGFFLEFISIHNQPNTLNAAHGGADGVCWWKRLCAARNWTFNFLCPLVDQPHSGKAEGLQSCKNKKAVRWGDNIKQFVVRYRREWFEDVDTVYVPMIWKASHWVGLVINLKLWSVEVLDSCPTLYAERKVQKYMEPVVLMLPYIIQEFCRPQASQTNGLNPFIWRRIEGMYENKRTGDCGPVSVKFMELHAHGHGTHAMAAITDKLVDNFRKQYAVDIYQGMIQPYFVK